jgi:citrate lyase subunit beta / citryl-CoA lyase
MRLRSLLFVPADSDRKLARSAEVPADAFILDLEDSVAPLHKSMARARLRDYLGSHLDRTRASFWVRINPLESPHALADLVAVMSGRPDGIVQPKVRSPEDVIQLSNYLDVLEAEHGLPAGSTGILPLATEVPQALFSLGQYARAGKRLAGLTWGPEDLSTAVGAATNKERDGSWTPPYQLARSLCLFGAHAAGVTAIDTVFADVRDEPGLRVTCELARRDGFGGKLAVHPDQVDVINTCFTPTQAEETRARRIVALFDANPELGVVALDGQMLDLPHLIQARKILQLLGSGVMPE